MDEFMMLYGDQINESPEYKKNPVEFLAKFINQTKKKIQKEQNELTEDAAKECTGNANAFVTVSDDTKWEQKVLSGCETKSECGQRASKITGKGVEQSTCMIDQSSIIETQSDLLAKAKAAHTKASKDLAMTEQKRKDAHAKYIENLKNHNEAQRVLQEIMDILNNHGKTKTVEEKEKDTESVFLEQKQKEALERVSAVAPILAFLESPIDTTSSERVQKLIEICEKFLKLLKDSTDALNEKEKVQKEEYEEDVSEFQNTMAEESKNMVECERKLKVAESSNIKCQNDYAKSGKHFRISIDVCVKSHKLFTRQYKDNEELFKLMHEVFKIVERKLTGTVKETITNAVRNSDATGSVESSASTGSADSAATGSSETGAEMEPPTAASGTENSEPANEEVKGKWANMWKDVLKKYDNDGDRRLTWEEVSSKSPNAPSKAQWREIAGDDDMKLSYNEFAKYMDAQSKKHHRPKPSPPPPPPPSTIMESQVKQAFSNALKIYDGNKDMHISFEEVSKKLPRNYSHTFKKTWREVAGEDMKLSYNEYWEYVKKQAALRKKRISVRQL